MSTTTANLALVKPAGTDKPKNFRTGYNGNMDAIDAAVAGNASAIAAVAEGQAIPVTGDVAPAAITEGKHIYLKGHSTLAAGTYKAVGDIAQGETLSNVNLTLDQGGAINALQAEIDALNSKTSNFDIYDITKWHQLQIGDNLHDYNMIYFAYLGTNHEIVNAVMIPILFLFVDPSKNDLSVVSFINQNSYASVRWDSSGIVTAVQTNACYVF